MQRCRFVWAIALVGLATPVFAQDEVELAWKFNKGDKFFQEMTTTTNQTMKIMGMDIKQNQEQTFLFSWTVKDATDQSTVIEQKIEHVKLSIKLQGNDIRYDSTAKDAADNPLAQFFKPIIGSSFTLTLDSNMKVTKVEGREEFIQKLTAANPNLANLLKTILSEDQLKQMSEPTFGVVPEKGTKVKADSTWSRASTLNMGPIGTYDATYEYKYAGTENRTIEGNETTLHKIELNTKLGYKAPEATEAGAGGIQFTINSGEIETTEAKGTIFFDAEKGRVAETSMTVKLKAKLNISVADQSADVELDQDQTTVTKTLGKDPYGPTS